MAQWGEISMLDSFLCLPLMSSVSLTHLCLFHLSKPEMPRKGTDQKNIITNSVSTLSHKHIRIHLLTFSFSD